MIRYKIYENKNKNKKSAGQKKYLHTVCKKIIGDKVLATCIVACNVSLDEGYIYSVFWGKKGLMY